MSTKGIEVVVTSGPLTDDRLEHIYTSIADTFVFCSVDMTVDEDANEIVFLIGVDLSDSMDSDEFAQDLVTDAINKAFGHTEVATEPQFQKVGVFC